jgi:hypothetical protein
MEINVLSDLVIVSNHIYTNCFLKFVNSSDTTKPMQPPPGGIVGRIGRAKRFLTAQAPY